MAPAPKALTLRDWLKVKRLAYKHPAWTPGQLAEKAGWSPETVANILNSRTWLDYQAHVAHDNALRRVRRPDGGKSTWKATKPFLDMPLKPKRRVRRPEPASMAIVIGGLVGWTLFIWALLNFN